LTDNERQSIHSNCIYTIRYHVFDFITTRLVPAFPKNDGQPTPMRGHPVIHCQACDRDMLPGMSAEIASN
jgi:hypothetical protein